MSSGAHCILSSKELQAQNNPNFWEAADQN